MPARPSTPLIIAPLAGAALLTPRGRGAVATIAIHNDGGILDAARPPIFRAAHAGTLAGRPIGRIIFGHWGEPSPEDVVLCRASPDLLEIHCHGGDAAASRILSDLAAVGVSIASASEFARERHGDFDAECLETLARATTVRTADILLQQHTGLLRKAIEEIVASLPVRPNPQPHRACPGGLMTDGYAGAQQAVETSGLPPACGSPQSFLHRGKPGGDAIEPEDATRAARDFSDPLSRLDALIRWADFGLHLTRPWRIVLAGRPNVGKSSLVNALVGFTRSIVLDQPGTTRDIVTAATAYDGWPLLFSDTAGLRDEADRLEAEGIRRTRAAVSAADLVLLLVDTSRPPHDDDRRLLVELPQALVVAHKCDLPHAWGDALPAGALRVSSLTGEGVDDLLRGVIARLVPQVPAPHTPLPVTDRQVAALRHARELLRAGDADACQRELTSLLGR